MYHIKYSIASVHRGQCTVNSLTVHIGHCTDVNYNLTDEYTDVSRVRHIYMEVC